MGFVDSDGAAPHPKPTLLLSSLPPNTSKPTITELLSSTPLKIDSIRIIPAPPPPGPSQPSPSIRKAASALVTLSQDTPISDIDAAVSSLNGRYMGYGFFLGIMRHLSSTVATAGVPILSTHSQPFGAKPARPAQRRSFAPPSSYRSQPPAGSAHHSQHSHSALQIHVHPPQDLKTLKLIHRTIEALLTHGPEFEALLMSKDSVRSDPRFAWLWDARCEAGVYYRWKLWEIVSGYGVEHPHRHHHHGHPSHAPRAVDIFDGASTVWLPPRKPLRHEWAGSLRDVVDEDGASDENEDDDSDEEGGSDRAVSAPGGDGRRVRGYLGVLERAKLIHLVSRVPTTTSKVRRGDIGRVMAFAMEHAEGGMGDEVVEILVGNVLRPLAFTKAAREDERSESDEEEEAPHRSQEHGLKNSFLRLLTSV